MFEDLITNDSSNHIENNRNDSPMTQEKSTWDTGLIWDTGQLPKEVWVAKD
jgi:hypothetical protein